MAEVTVLMVDIVNSSNLSAQLGDKNYRDIFLPAYSAALLGDVEAYRGKKFQEQGQFGDDCKKAHFDSPVDAVGCAVAIQNLLKQYEFPAGIQVGKAKVEIHLALHTCEAMDDGTPSIVAIPTAARILKLSAAGQILLSTECHTAYRNLQSFPWECREYRNKSFHNVSGAHSIFEPLYDGLLRPEPGTRLIGFQAVEAANAYIPRPGKEYEVTQKFHTVIGQGAICRMVTIHGDGGMGKTRLGINCARQMAEDFPGGVAFVRLAAVSPTDKAIAGAILSSLDLKEESTDLVGQLVRFLAGRPKTLLVLDNAETVAQAKEVRQLFQKLLDIGAQVHLLVTSRRTVGLTSRELPVDVNDGLSLEEARALFWERAGTPEDERQPGDPDLAKLLELAYYIPLAIELIAARARDYAHLKDLRTRYEAKVFNLLTALPEGEDPHGTDEDQRRHRSLEASLHWSWECLGREEGGQDAQSVFVAASLFVETSDAQGIDAVLGWNDLDRTEEAIHKVLRSSLLRVDDSFIMTRYRMLRFSRAYGLEERFRRASYEQDLSFLPVMGSLKQNFIVYYYQLVAASREKLGKADSIETGQVLDAEWRNALEATEIARQNKQWFQSVWIHIDLSQYFMMYAKWFDWESSAKTAHNIATEQWRDREMEGGTWNNLGSVYESRGRWSEAELAYKQALNIQQEFKYRQGESITWNNLGNVYARQERWSEAEEAYKHSIDIKQEFKDRQGEGQSLGNLGNVYESQGRWPEAEEALKQSLYIKREFKDRHGEALTMENLGIVHQNQGRWPEAEAAFNHALVIKREFKDQRGEGQTLGNIAILFAKQEQFERAVELAREGLAIMRQTEDKVSEQLLENLLADYQQSAKASGEGKKPRGEP